MMSPSELAAPLEVQRPLSRPLPAGTRGCSELNFKRAGSNPCAFISVVGATPEPISKRGTELAESVVRVSL
jgi:hypothetical protein